MDASERGWAWWFSGRTPRRALSILVSVCLLVGAFGLGRASATWGQPAEEAPGAEDGAVGRTIGVVAWFAQPFPRDGERGEVVLELGGDMLSDARTVAWGSDIVRQAWHIAIAPDGTPYTACSTDKGWAAVECYEPELSSWTEAPARCSWPSGIAIAPDGSVYVSWRGGIMRYSPDLSSHLNGMWGDWLIDSIVVAPDGTVYAAGAEDASSDFPFTGLALIRRYSPELDLMSEARLEGLGESGFASVAVSPDGTVFALANVGEGGSGGGGLVIHYDQWLTEIGKVRLGGEDVSLYKDITIVSDGSLYILGGCYETGTMTSSHITKLGSDLAEVGCAVLSSANEDLDVKALAAAPDNSIYAVGRSDFGDYAFVIHFGPDLVVLGSGTWNDSAYYDVAVAPDGSAYAVGWGYSRNPAQVTGPLVVQYHNGLPPAQ